jgi:type IV secretion system protein TrbJ
MKPFTATSPRARKLIVPVGLAFVVLCVVPKPAHAIFGLGDIVYDPTNWGEAVKQLEQDIKLVEQGIQTYNLLQSELRMMQQRPWETLATALSDIQIPVSGNSDNADDDDGGEAAAVGSAANGSGDALSAWQSAMMRMQAVTDTTSRVLDRTSPVLANNAGIKMTDGFAADAIHAVGDFRAHQPMLAVALSALQRAEQSLDPLDNTPVAQQNITNGVLMQQIKLQQSSSSLLAVIAEQLTAANAWQRNSAAEATNIQNQALNARNANPADYANAGGTLTDYLIN